MDNLVAAARIVADALEGLSAAVKGHTQCLLVGSFKADQAAPVAPIGVPAPATVSLFDAPPGQSPAPTSSEASAVEDEKMCAKGKRSLAAKKRVLASFDPVPRDAFEDHRLDDMLPAVVKGMFVAKKTYRQVLSEYRSGSIAVAEGGTKAGQRYSTADGMASIGWLVTRIAIENALSGTQEENNLVYNYHWSQWQKPADKIYNGRTVNAREEAVFALWFLQHEETFDAN